VVVDQMNWLPGTPWPDALGGDTFRPYDPQHSHDFLVSDLARHPGKPLILMQHFGFDRHSLTWWKEENRQKYLEAIGDRNVLGIFHGHDHNSSFFKWNGIDIFNAPHMHISESEPQEPARLAFLVVRITRTEMLVAERRLDDTWGMHFRKPLPTP
jgi:cytolysin (calcineurin-like family phosphatase)